MSLLKLTVRAIFFSNETRFPSDSSGALNVDRVLADMAAIAPSLPDDSEARNQLLQEARNSLNEVKALTEYQDEKASRLLTAVAFLLAAAVGVFVKFIDIFPIAKYKSAASFGEFLVLASYSSFALYCLLSIWGTFLVFVGTQSRFLWGQKGLSAVRSDVRSRLFFRAIIETKPDAWARSFDCGDAGRNSRSGIDLLNSYYRNYVSETYLVAAKVAEKLLYLEPAQLILRASIISLMTWGLFFGCAMMITEPRGKDFVVEKDLSQAKEKDGSKGSAEDATKAEGPSVMPGIAGYPIKIEITNLNEANTPTVPAKINRVNKVKEHEKGCDCSDGCRQHTVGHQCGIPAGAN